MISKHENDINSVRRSTRRCARVVSRGLIRSIGFVRHWAFDWGRSLCVPKHVVNSCDPKIAHCPKCERSGPGDSPHALVLIGGRYWDRTSGPCRGETGSRGLTNQRYESLDPCCNRRLLSRDVTRYHAASLLSVPRLSRAAPGTVTRFSGFCSTVFPPLMVSITAIARTLAGSTSGGLSDVVRSANSRPRKIDLHGRTTCSTL